MDCENCGEADAVIHLTQVVNNKMSSLHLCEQCAAAKGLETEGPPAASFPLQEFLAEMGGESPAPAPAPVDEKCGFCGLTFQGFRKAGRLGCPHCYISFEGHLRALLGRIHNSTQHVGKVYLPPDPTASQLERRLEGLRGQLRRAVDAEDFERAAGLRDEIRILEAEGVT
ncbi:UvrB/UvrC motif-containing protein [Gaopeijia maritima]|uniref:UvrB/UvrC motif-containing protein n=1 Tax=Gaopeijia maritima TaxID=3119007 RepID=A0ABU9E5V1_9BACT